MDCPQKKVAVVERLPLVKVRLYITNEVPSCINSLHSTVQRLPACKLTGDQTLEGRPRSNTQC